MTAIMDAIATANNGAIAAPTMARIQCPICQNRRPAVDNNFADIRCTSCRDAGLIVGRPIVNCQECWRTMTPETLAENGTHYCDACVTMRQGRADAREAIAEGIHDMYVMHRGFNVALKLHGWASHTVDNHTEYARAFSAVLNHCGLSARDTYSWPHFVGGTETMAAVGSLTLWGPGAVLAFGSQGEASLRERPEFGITDNSAVQVTADDMRRMVRDCWESVMEIANRQAEENSYCTEFESTMTRIHGEFLTYDMAEPEPRNREFTVRIPVTITAYATVVVSARDEYDAVEMAGENGIDRSDIELDRHYFDFEEDWDGAEAEEN